MSYPTLTPHFAALYEYCIALGRLGGPQKNKVALIYTGTSAKLLGELYAPCPRREELCCDALSEVA